MRDNNARKSQEFRARFRFRLQKKLDVKAREYKLRISARDVILSPPRAETDICDSDWLVMNARGFESEFEARTFATRLKAACEVSAVATRLGIDSGADLPSSAFSQLVTNHVRALSGILLGDNAHGVDVFCDDPNVRIAHVSATATVRAAPGPFLAEINELHDVVANASPTTRDIVLLLNDALMRPEPVAQIVFAFSTVEMLGEPED